MNYYREVWVIIAISWFLVALASFVFLYWLPSREKGMTNTKKLGMIMVGMVVILHFASEGYSWLNDLVYEPAGNPWQVFILDVAPLWIRRLVYPFVDRFIRPPYYLFWLGVALWLTNRKESE